MTSLIHAVLLSVPTFAAADDQPAAKFEIRRAETKPGEGLTEATVAGRAEKIYLHKAAEITNADIARARVVEDDQKNPTIEMTFTRAAMKKVGALTEGHRDKPLAILIDGKVVSVPVVKARFSERAVITGGFTKEEAERIVKSIGRK